jgi:predicted acetyltransferase
LIRIAVRALVAPVEVSDYFQLLAETFTRDRPFVTGAPQQCTPALWQRSVEHAPAFHPSQIRGIVDGGIVRGAYTIYERTLCLGAARLRLGFIAGVVTHPEYRRQGIATVLMDDALAYGRAHDYCLLLLNGLRNFYRRFGYSDVMDFTVQTINRSHVLTAPTSTDHIRRATLADAQLMLAMYHRHYDGYPGSFTRTLEQQRHHIACRIEYDAPVIAMSPEGEASGYLIFPLNPFRYAGCEVAADTWPAALALLQYHARLLGSANEPPHDIMWVLPPDVLTFYLLADYLQVRSETTYQPNAGLMARPGNLRALMNMLLPEWRKRWTRQAIPHSGTFALTVDGTTWFTALEPGDVRFLDGPQDGMQTVTLSHQVFTQLVFGCRSAAWAARQAGQSVPTALLAPLAVLFPQFRAWFAPADGV